MQKQRLELDWIGKDDEIKIEPRILIKRDEKFGTANRGKLIKGDNLLALKALEDQYANKIKCIYIDPPYNTGSALAQYDDGMEHSLWLSLMSERLKILWKLLSREGSIWISIDDYEVHYLKVLCDELFGRQSFIHTIIWEMRKSRENRRAISNNHEYILVYAKDPSYFAANRNKLPLSEAVKSRYKNPDDDPRGPWQSISALAQAGHATPSQFYTLTTPSGRKIDPSNGNCWRYTESRMNEMIADNRIWFGKDGNNAPRVKRFLSENPDDGLTPETFWKADDVGTNDQAKKHLKDMFKKKELFETPKPESLIARIFDIATNPGDLVLDSFLGSGTTAAVALKMGRRWIGVEMGEHTETIVLPRLKKVISGSDNGGITSAKEWSGGGGFEVFDLAPSLLQKDNRGNWVISQKYNAVMLAEAVCKHEGFKFWPDQNLYWKQGHSSEKDFIFVTTQFLTAEQLDKIAVKLKPDESLLICAKAFKVSSNKYPNITIKKIPQMLLGRCEFGKDDYSLNIKEAVQEEMELEDL